MSRVDPDDDSIRRFVVYHHRYDPDRHERRHVVVAAFDNKGEWNACMAETQAELRRRRAKGEAVEPYEGVSGVVLEPGYRRRQQNARVVRRAMKHGVMPTGWEDLELPSNFAILRGTGEPSRWRRILRRLRPGNLMRPRKADWPSDPT